MANKDILPSSILILSPGIEFLVVSNLAGPTIKSLPKTNRELSTSSLVRLDLASPPLS